jgi:hypothetical protein
MSRALLLGKNSKVSVWRNDFWTCTGDVSRDRDRLILGAIVGRAFNSVKFEDRELVGTSQVVDGAIENGSIVTVKSGRRFFLSGEELKWKGD